ncbi:hypothetical protein FF011L_18830 [Roseimaritima multifibrata]|uniref:Uncharacterized protein n=1 Tax=Roseimaritima multifibrata TaxID=1930274 RepID=A0A517ME19_9BACT|nr:hypothetical protein FF011L_18830 [Roseimaritima multifibrata]
MGSWSGYGGARSGAGLRVRGIVKAKMRNEDCKMAVPAGHFPFLIFHYSLLIMGSWSGYGGARSGAGLRVREIVKAQMRNEECKMAVPAGHFPFFIFHYSLLISGQLVWIRRSPQWSRLACERNCKSSNEK